MHVAVTLSLHQGRVRGWEGLSHSSLAWISFNASLKLGQLARLEKGTDQTADRPPAPPSLN